MIRSWKHKGLKKFFEAGNVSGIQAKHAKILKLLLFQLAADIKPEDMNTPGNAFHKLKGSRKKHYAVKISGNWRLIFRFECEHALDVELIDYH